MHTDDFMPLQLLARVNPFLFPEGGGACRIYIPTSVESCKGNPSSSQALAGIAHEIRGPATSAQANEGGEPGLRKIKFLFKCRRLQQ